MKGVRTAHTVETEGVYWRYDPDGKILSGGLVKGVYVGEQAMDWLQIDINRLQETLDGLFYFREMVKEK